MGMLDESPPVFIHLNHGPPVTTMMEQRARGQPAVVSSCDGKRYLCVYNTDCGELRMACILGWQRLALKWRGVVERVRKLELKRRRGEALRLPTAFAVNGDALRNGFRRPYVTTRLFYDVIDLVRSRTHRFQAHCHRRSKLFRNRIRFTSFYILHIII